MLLLVFELLLACCALKGVEAAISLGVLSLAGPLCIADTAMAWSF